MTMNFRSHIFSSLIFFFSFLLSISANAFYTNYNSILMGDLSAGMGGAGTGLLGDVSSAGYYNPGTLAFLRGKSFSAAVGVYKKIDTEYGEQNDFTKAALKVNLGFFRSLPASTGSVISWRDYKLGLSIAVPFYDSYRGDISSVGDQVTTINYTDESLWVGGVISKKVNPTTSFGLTLYYTAENQVRSVNDRSVPTSATAQFFTSERTLTSNSIVPVFGYFQKVTPNLSGGISLRLRGLPLSTTGSYFENYTDVANPANSTAFNKLDIPGQVQIPSKLSFGYSYWIYPNLLWTGSLDFYEALTYDDFELANYSTHIEQLFTTNGSMGLEWAYKSWLKFRTGIFTNFSSVPDPQVGIYHFQPEHVDQLGFSANFVLIAQKNISYTFGGYYTGGKGQSLQRINQAYQVIPVTKQVFTMLVGTSFSL